VADVDIVQPRSRRTLLLAALGGTVASVVGALGRPAPAEATSGTMFYGTSNNSGVDPTGLTAATPSEAALDVTNASTGTGLIGRSSGTGGVGVYGHAELGFAVVGDISIFTKGSGKIGVWGRDRDTPGKIGTAGTSYGGTGVVGYAIAGAGDTIPPTPSGLVGVYGYAPGGTGVAARSDTGTALKVTGKVSLNRSGKVNFPANATYIDITPPGGLSGTPLCFANLMEFRPGVYIAAIRPNWPSAGKVRIYLNKAASTTLITPLSWMVIG
jgi:hypothetical protein